MSVVLPNLLLGDFQESFDHELLAASEVTHVLNVASELNVSERVGRHYAKLALPDDCPHADIGDVLPDCMRFIKAAHDAGGCVLVHCLEGVSRSACVVLCYMVRHLGWDDLDAALAFVRARRPCVDPFPRYLAQTRDYLATTGGTGPGPRSTGART